MANILDYLTWRGDITIDQNPFNEIDNLILARISYLPFDHLIEEKEKITLAEIYNRFIKEDKKNVRILQKEDLDLFPVLAQSRRFGNLQMSHYINKIDEKLEKQFSAITISLPDNTIYVSYRGTDNTLIGWKEDLNMSFLDQVPAQVDAVQYLENIANEQKNKIRVGGHSKGGNLAVYAATFCQMKIQDRIIEVDNNDGPGVHDTVSNTENYHRIVGKIKTYIPQSSVIGRLLTHEEKYQVVKSTQVGILQHDLYSWQLLGPNFIHLQEVTDGSVKIDRTIKQWLKEVSPEQRSQFIDILFEILGTTQAKTLAEIRVKWLESAKVIFMTYKNIDEKDKEIVYQTLSSLFSIAKENMISKPEKKKIQFGHNKLHHT